MANDDAHGKAISDDELERRAETLRVITDTELEWAPDLFEIAKKLSLNGLHFAKLTVRVRPDSEMDGDEAKAYVEDKIIELSQTTLDGLRINNPRCRMTFAHELAHIALNHSGAVRHRKIAGNKTPSFIRHPNSVERQARVWAAAFLMPKKLVRQCANAAEIASRMKVSMEAAEIRFKKINVLQAAKKTPDYIQREIDKLKAQSGVTSRSPKPSVLSSDQQMRLLWAIAHEAENEDPNEYRCIDSRYVIRWSRRGESRPGGWRIINGCIIPWDEERSR